MATDSCRPSVSVRPDRTLGGGVHRVVGETDLDRSVGELGAACGERHRGIGVDLDGQGMSAPLLVVTLGEANIPTSSEGLSAAPSDSISKVVPWRTQ